MLSSTEGDITECVDICSRKTKRKAGKPMEMHLRCWLLSYMVLLSKLLYNFNFFPHPFLYKYERWL